MTASSPHVVSLQSFVSHGHVGNSVALFALQRQGVSVSALHTVMYSSHLGHAGWRGAPVEPALLAELVEGLQARGALAHSDALLTGFLGSMAHGAVALDCVERMRARHPATRWVCDPVLGDQGRLYVDASMIEFYAEQALALVDVLTPNVSELGWLSGTSTSSAAPEALFAAMSQLLERMPQGAWVMTTGVPDSPDTLQLLLASAEQRWVVSAPRFARGFGGAGDLFAASLCAALVGGAPPEAAAQQAAARVAGVLEQTHALGADELELISAQRCLEVTGRADVTLTRWLA